MMVRAILGGVVVIWAVSASAADWTEFRGPTGQGHAEARGLPLTWSPNENVDWKVAVAGKGWSSPVVLGKQIFLTSAVAGDDGSQNLHVLCLEANSGMTVWDVVVFEHPQAKIHGKNTHASPTPVTDGQHLFVHFGTHGTACLDLAGQVVWKNTEIKYSPVHGNGGSPVLVDGKLVFSCDGGDAAFVIALDQKTGKTVWKTARPETSGNTFAFCTPLVIAVDGQTQIVSPGAGWVVAYEPADGAEIWKVSYPGGFSVVPRPVYGQGLVFLSTGFNTPTVLAIRPDGRGDVTETHIAWKYTRSGPRNASPILIHDALYLVSDNGILTSLDARTGKDRWQKRLAGDYSASPLFADGKLYVQNEAGEATVLEVGEKSKELARNKLDERTLASYGLVDSSLLIRTESHLYRVSAKAP